MKSPLVSVVMNCRNGERFVHEAIQSVLQQSMGDFELVFWDNRSTDSTAEIVKGIPDTRIRYILSDHDDSLGQARNRAFAEARGQWIAIIDSDDIWLPHFLESQLTELKESGASMIYSNATYFYPDGRERLCSWRPGTKVEVIDYQQLALDYDITISTVLLEQKILSELSYVFDPELTVSEETDLFIRIAHRYKVVFNPQVLARYRMHAESDTWRRSDEFIRDAEKISRNFEQAGLNPELVQNGIMESAYWTAAVSSWMMSKGADTRQYLQSMRKRQLRIPLLFCLSFFPYRLIAPFLRMAGKRVF